MSRVDVMIEQFEAGGGIVTEEHADDIARARDAESRLDFGPNGGARGPVADHACMGILEWVLFGNTLGRWYGFDA